MFLHTFLISRTTIVVHSRDHEGVGMAHKITSTKNQSKFSMTMEQYWLGKTKPKQAFRLTVKKLLQNFYIMD